MSPVPISAEQVSNALHYLGVTLDDLVALHMTNTTFTVEEVVRDERGNVRLSISDPNRPAITPKFYVIDYHASDNTKALTVADTGDEDHA